MNNGKLYIVATPIGNLEDITYRAVRILSEVDYILAEDTRVTGVLLAKYGIAKPQKRYDAHASEKTHDMVLEDIAAGKKIALVSDAGTPCISDPGVLLVKKAREAHLPIEAIPGVSAITTAFSIAGIEGNQFAFRGFVPHKKGRETFFKAIADDAEIPHMFYESVHRIEKTLESLAQHLSVDRTVTVARELTKLHEEVIQGTPEEVRDHYKNNPSTIRGEFVVIVS